MPEKTNAGFFLGDLNPKAEREINHAVYYGTIAHTPKLGDLEIVNNALVGIDSSGTISFISKEKFEDADAILKYASLSFSVPVDQIELMDHSGDPNKFIFPGFIDTHIHAPQFPNNGIFGNTTLLDWLETYTFPLESSFKDLDVATEIYSKAIDRTLGYGTTMASYYATIHTDASKLLCDLALRKGQRAFVGKVCMDQNAPDHYLETVEEAKKSTLDVIEHVKQRDPTSKLAAPILTPRFAGSCTDELLQWLGQLRKEGDHHVQTHLSENHREIEWIEGMFPQYDNYTDIYHKTNLLSSKTVLAHCIHLTDEEMKVLQRTGSGVSHCPTSNSSITSGEARIRWLLDNNISVSLGSDCSGGFSPSILEVSRHALLVSRHLVMKTKDDNEKLTPVDVLYLATMGGAKVMSMDDHVGSFAVGKKWDAQLIDLKCVDSNVDSFAFQEPKWGFESTAESEKKFRNLIDKWLFNGDNRNVRKVWVNGREVVSRV